MQLQLKERRDYTHIIWDWNGTLLDDLAIVIHAMNRLLKKRGLPLLNLKRYQEIFTFPVKDYYHRLGFDFSKEPYEDLAKEYIAAFRWNQYPFQLFQGAERVLASLKGRGMGQSILSACKEEDLKNDVAQWGLTHYFALIAGLDDELAHGKVERGRELLEDLDIRPSAILLIGDTYHDFEVARELRCDCLLVSTGHQSYERLSSVGAPVVCSLDEVLSIFNGL